MNVVSDNEPHLFMISYFDEVENLPQIQYTKRMTQTVMSTNIRPNDILYEVK